MLVRWKGKAGRSASDDCFVEEALSGLRNQGMERGEFRHSPEPILRGSLPAKEMGFRERCGTYVGTE